MICISIISMRYNSYFY